MNQLVRSSLQYSLFPGGFYGNFSHLFGTSQNFRVSMREQWAQLCFCLVQVCLCNYLDFKGAAGELQ